MQQLHSNVKYNEVVGAEYVKNVSGEQIFFSCSKQNTGQQTLSRPNNCKQDTDQVGCNT